MSGVSIHTGTTLRSPSDSPWYDRSQAGSTWSQIAIGAIGIFLAIVLVAGQVSVATSRGIQQNLEVAVEHMGRGNELVKQIADHSGPSVQVEKTIRKQAASLAETRDVMVQLNAEMAKMGATTAQLKKLTLSMQKTSGSLSKSMGSMNRDTGAMVATLRKMNAGATRTHKRLQVASHDSGLINNELTQITGKMQRYGLPKARGVQR